MNLKDPPPFVFTDAPACWKEPFFIKIDLGQRDITITENDPIFPWRKHSGELDIIICIAYLNLHHFHFFSAPELLLSGPLIPCSPPIFLERVEQGKEIVSLPLGIEPGPEGIFESMEQILTVLDPEDHRRL